MSFVHDAIQNVVSVVMGFATSVSIDVCPSASENIILPGTSQNCHPASPRKARSIPDASAAITTTPGILWSGPGAVAALRASVKLILVWLWTRRLRMIQSWQTRYPSLESQYQDTCAGNLGPVYLNKIGMVFHLNSDSHRATSSCATKSNPGSELRPDSDSPICHIAVRMPNALRRFGLLVIQNVVLWNTRLC